MPILRKAHGNAPGAATCTPSCTGKSANRLPERTLPDGRSIEFRTKGKNMAKLFFVNIPYNCSDRELQEWVESRGIETRSIRIIRDLVAGVSPAFGYVELKDDSVIKEAITVLNGKKMRNQTILVKEAQTMASYSGERRSA